MKKLRSLLLVWVMICLLAACGKSSTPAWQEQYDLGMQYLTEGDYSAAIVAFTAAIEIEPKKASLYVARGGAYVVWAEETETSAMSALAEGESLDWSEVIVSYGEDGEYSLMELYENAVHDYEEAIDLLESGEDEDPSDDLLYEAKEKLKEIEDKIEEYELSQTEETSEEIEEEIVEEEAGLNIVYLFSKEFYTYSSDTYSTEFTIDYSYDSDTRILTGIKTTDGESYTSIVQTYDMYGELVKSVDYGSDGNASYSIEHEYSEEGILTQSKSYIFDSNGSIKYYSDYEYDEKGNLIEFTRYNSDGSVLYSYEHSREYDENLNLIRYIFYVNDPNGNVSAESSTTEHEYDESGNQIKSTQYDSEGNVTYINEYEYDEFGNQTKSTVYDGDGVLKSTTEYKYDENGNMIEQCTNAIVTFSESTNGVVTKSGTYDSVDIERYEYMAIEFESR